MLFSLQIFTRTIKKSDVINFASHEKFKQTFRCVSSNEHSNIEEKKD